MKHTYWSGVNQISGNLYSKEESQYSHQKKTKENDLRAKLKVRALIAVRMLNVKRPILQKHMSSQEICEALGACLTYLSFSNIPVLLWHHIFLNANMLPELLLLSKSSFSSYDYMISDKYLNSFFILSLIPSLLPVTDLSVWSANFQKSLRTWDMFSRKCLGT